MPEDQCISSVTRRQFIAAGAGAGTVALAGCSGDDRIGSGDCDCDGSREIAGDINIAGSSTVFPLMEAISEEFSGEYRDVNVDLSSTGSGAGFLNHFCPGNTDFNNASRQIKESERQLCEDNGVEYLELIAATDALTVIVNNDADFVDCLTVEELARIWESDSVDTWDELRDEFPSEPIERYGAADTSGTYDYFIENVQGEERGHTNDYQATERDNTIIQGVRGNPYAIGYFGFSFYYQNPEQVKALAIDNGDGCVLPELETASSGQYQPLSRNLYTYVSKSSLEEAHIQEFARFFIERTTSEEIVAERVGYVPSTEEQKFRQRGQLEAVIDEVTQS